MVSKRHLGEGIIPFIILAFLFMLSAAYAVNAQIFYTDFFVTVKDINSGEIITSMPVELNWYKPDTETTINLTKYLDKRGTFSYRISPGKWRLQIYVDDRSTPEEDYFGEATYSITDDVVTRGETIYVVPIGSLELSVADASGSLIAGADLGFKCKSYKGSTKTDRFGSYKAENLPVGQCKVSAAFTNLIGSTSVEIIQGQESSIQITLSEAVITSPLKGHYYYLAGALMIALLLLLYYGIIRKRLKKQVKEEVEKRIKKRPVRKAKETAEPKASKAEKPGEEKEGLNPRARDIMKTLNEKEQRITNFLLENKNKSTQATIRNETAIPKTTLARIFQALEARKVVKVETIGKMKKIELTDWFLGKE